MPIGYETTGDERSVAFELETAREAFEAVRPRLAAVSDGAQARARFPSGAALVSVIATAEFTQQPTERERFAAMPGFQVSNVDDHPQHSHTAVSIYLGCS